MSRSMENGSAGVDLDFAVALLPLWGVWQGLGIAHAGEQGTNNRTFLVSRGQQRYVLRVSGFLSVEDVRAEHRVLRRLRQGRLPFQVPEPVAALDGRTGSRRRPGPPPCAGGCLACTMAWETKRRSSAWAVLPACLASRWRMSRSQTRAGTGAPTRDRAR
jgi:hypothetical protein